MDDDRQALLEGLHWQLTDLAVRKQFPWLGTERGKIYVGGLLNYPLFQLIPLLMRELASVGLTGGKDSSPFDLPPEPGTVAVDAGDGQTVWIKPGAYRDDEGHPRTEVREKPARTDLAIMGALAAMEGGEPDPQRLRTEYERLWQGRAPEREHGFEPVPAESEKALILAHALLENRDPVAFGELSEPGRRERVVSVAKRIGTVVKTLRELAADLETGTVNSTIRDAQRDVLAAELHDLNGLTYQETARRLKMGEPSEGDRIKSRHQRAEHAVKRGRKLLDQVHGGGGRWLKYAAEHRRKARSTD
jgi:hypothetical protein